MTCPNDIRQLITSRSLKFVVRASNWIAVLISRNFRLFLNILVNASRVNNVKVTGDTSPPSPIGLIEKCYQYWFRRPSSIITSLDNRQLRTMNIHRAALAHSWSCNLGAWMTNRKCAILLAAGASNKVIINSILLERSLRTSLALLIASMSLRPIGRSVGYALIPFFWLEASMTSSSQNRRISQVVDKRSWSIMDGETILTSMLFLYFYWWILSLTKRQGINLYT